jgi:hypothetical protein
MMFRSLVAASVTIFALALVIDGSVEGGKDKEKGKDPTVKEIMMKAHGKDGLRKKVIDGKASNEEKKALVDLYTALAACKCPKGDETDWKDRTKAVVVLVKSGEPADLKKIDCMGCHKNHKK